VNRKLLRHTRISAERATRRKSLYLLYNSISGGQGSLASKKQALILLALRSSFKGYQRNNMCPAFMREATCVARWDSLKQGFRE